MRIIAAAIVLVPMLALAQQACLCTTGCVVASDPFPPDAFQPTLCTIYQAGSVIAAASVIDSALVPVSNATTCRPANADYAPGPPGSVACFVPIPPQPKGQVILTGTATGPLGESPQSDPLTFLSWPACTVCRFPMRECLCAMGPQPPQPINAPQRLRARFEEGSL